MASTSPERLQRDAVAVLREPAVRDKLAADNTEPVGNAPGEFAAFIKDQIVKWAAVAKNAGIVPE